MKNLLSTRKVFLLLALFLSMQSNMIKAQNGDWDYIEFTEDLSFNVSAHIDNNDNVYSVNYSTQYLTLSKITETGTVVWEKDLTSEMFGETFEVQNYRGGLYGIHGNDNDVFVVGRDATGTPNGVIVQSDFIAGTSPATIEKLGGASSIIRDIKVVGDFMYVVGDFGGINTPVTNVYFDNSPSDPTKNLDGTYYSGFVAKFSLSSTELVWARVINASNVVKAKYLDLDDAGDIYVSGEFKGTATFHTPGGGLYLLNSLGSGTNSFLAKFDNLTGDQIGFNPKVVGETTGSSRYAGDLAVSETNNSIYWGVEDIRAYNMTSGISLSTWVPPFTGLFPARIFGVTANSCGDVYATGSLDQDLINANATAPDRSSVSCNTRFFALSLNGLDASTVWVSQASSGCESIGTEVLLNSSNEELILGAFNKDATNSIIEIDDNFAPGTNMLTGGFIGKYDDASVDQCCVEEVSLGGNIAICQNEAFPTLSIVGQITENIISIQWIHNLSIVASGVESYTTTGPGNYMVIVNYGDGCTTQDLMTLAVKSCYAACDFKPSIKIIPKSKCSYQFSGSVPSSVASSIVGTHWSFGDGATSLAATANHVYAAAGSYWAVFTVYSLDENGNCCTVSTRKLITIKTGCGFDCNINAKFTMEYVANDVYFFNALSPTLNTGAITVIGYEWTVNNTVVSTDQAFAMEIIGSPSICLTVYAFSGKTGCCQDTECKTVSRRRGKEEMVEVNTFSFGAYPNPANDILNIDVETLNDSVEEINIQVFDALGKEVYTTTVEEDTHQIDIRNWNAGIYFCRVEKSGRFSVQKIIKATGNSN